MRKILLSAVAVAAISAAAPASAQSGILGSVQSGILGSVQSGILGEVLGGLLGGGRDSRIERFDDQIRIAYQRGELSEREARQLEAEYFQLLELEQSYREDGLSRGERLDLQRRADQLQRRLQAARFDRDDRFDDRDDRFRDRDGRFRERFEDRDDRSFRRNGCPPGLAKKNPECLPPGQAKKRGQFYDDRDGRFSRGYQERLRERDRFIYRRDESGRLLQIDPRTGRVVRVIRSR